MTRRQACTFELRSRARGVSINAKREHVSFLVGTHFIAEATKATPPPSVPANNHRHHNHHRRIVVRCICTREIHKIRAYMRFTSIDQHTLGLDILFSRVQMRGGKRAEEFFRLTDEAGSSLLECHCKVQGVYVPFRARPPRAPCLVCRMHLHLHPRTRFVLIYVDEYNVANIQYL